MIISVEDIPENYFENEDLMNEYVANLSSVDRMHLAGQVLTTKEFREFIAKEGISADDFDGLDRLIFQSYNIGDDPLSVCVDASDWTREQVSEFIRERTITLDHK